MSDLTDEEIIATRKLHRLNKTAIDMYETVLNMIKEKDKAIEKLKKHNKELLRKLRNRVKEVMLKDIKEIADTKVTELRKIKEVDRLESENWILQVKLQDKDKIIDLMAETIRKLAILLANYRGGYNEETIHFAGNIKDIKQYFKSKAEKE